MTGDVLLDDDYVAKLLAEDARKTSRSHAAGLTTSVRRDGLKPNTRFLSHIVREADGHNAALKRKEEEEARRRLRALQSDAPQRKKRRTDETDSSKRRRLLSDIVGASHQRTSRRSAREDRGRDEKTKSHLPSARHSDTKRYRSRCSASPGREEEQRRERSASRERRRRRTKDSSLVNDTAPRGRGSNKSKRSTDHLAEDYDPSLDVSDRSDLEDDDDGDDWGMALEAVRDRARYKKSQSSRMRGAGFSATDIAKFEQSLTSDLKDVGDTSQIKWSRSGVREWDKDK